MSLTQMEQIEKTARLAENNQLSLMVFQSNFPADNYQKPPYYGVNVFKVREVLEGRVYQINPLPESNSLVEGMIELRGTYLPVIDLPKWLGKPMTSDEVDRSVIIVCDFSKNFVGLRVAHIHGVEEHSWEEIHLSKNYNLDVDASKIVNHTHIVGADDLCFILDIERLLLDAIPALAQEMMDDINRLTSNQEDSGLSVEFKNKTLLFAEDSKSIQKYMQTVFDSLGVRYLCFDNGRLLLDYVATLDSADDISCIFTDLEMPEASGYTVIKELRANSKFQKKPIVVHTSMTSGNNTREALRLGADYFIGKVDTALIIEVITKIHENPVSVH